MLLNWYFSMKIFLERFKGFLKLKIDFENQILHFLTSIFGHLTSLMEKSIPFLWSVQFYLATMCLVYNWLDFPFAMNEIDECSEKKTGYYILILYIITIGIISRFDKLFFLHTLDIINSKTTLRTYFALPNMINQ